MENIDILHGSTSISLPGINGDKGERSRVFFYGNDKLTGSSKNNIRFTANGNVSYARRHHNDATTPQPYDYIFYTEGEFDYIYLINNVAYSQNYYNCDVEEIDKINLSEMESSYSGMTNFILNIVSRTWSRNVRNVNSYGTLWAGNLDYNIYPKSYLQTTYNLLYDFSLTVPSTSNYTFTQNIKITIEFNSIQSSQMDSVLFDKFDASTRKNTYRGNIEKYAIKDYNGNTKIINFDDERLENFTITIKDYNDGIGSKYFTTSIPIIAEPLRRFMANPRAFLCVYKKEDYFIKKSVISELDLSFILDASPTQNTPSVSQIEIKESF